MEFPFIKYSRIYFIFSGTLVLASIIALLVYGFNWGIDFVGGSVLTVEYQQERPPLQELREKITGLGFKNFSVRYSGEREITVRIPEMPQEEKEKLSEFFYNDPRVIKEKISFESVSPVIGQETKDKARRAVILSIIAIVVYVAVAFRKISRPVKSWQYGIAAVIALIHDVLIPLGLFAVLSRTSGTEFSIPILTALLTVFGYSVNDTVVIFDRIRENIARGGGVDFEETINKSLNETLSRSINTAFTTLLALLAIFFFGGATLKFFSLTLIIGIVCGTYSSIFLAAPLLVKWQAFKERH